jgi:hypothetical protein
MKKLFKMLLFLTAAGVLFGCSSSDTSSSTSSDNSTTTDNTSTSDSCSVNDGFIKYDSSGTAVSDCAASWESIKIEEMSLIVEYKSLVSSEMDRTYADAVVYCAALSKSGFTDWKVPAQVNLKTIITVSSTAVDPNNYYYLPYINPNIEYGWSTKYYYYWSSEEYDNDSQKTVNWYDRGTVYVTDLTEYGTRNKTDLARIICVRDSN